MGDMICNSWAYRNSSCVQTSATSCLSSEIHLPAEDRTEDSREGADEQGAGMEEWHGEKVHGVEGRGEGARGGWAVGKEE